MSNYLNTNIIDTNSEIVANPEIIDPMHIKLDDEKTIITVERSVLCKNYAYFDVVSKLTNDNTVTMPKSINGAIVIKLIDEDLHGIKLVTDRQNICDVIYTMRYLHADHNRIINTLYEYLCTINYDVVIHLEDEDEEKNISDNEKKAIVDQFMTRVMNDFQHICYLFEYYPDYKTLFARHLKDCICHIDSLLCPKNTYGCNLIDNEINKRLFTDVLVNGKDKLSLQLKELLLCANFHDRYAYEYITPTTLEKDDKRRRFL